jgi:cytochrome c biogenesis protein CcdA
MVYGDKFLVGDQPIIDLFSQKLQVIKLKEAQNNPVPPVSSTGTANPSAEPKGTFANTLTIPLLVGAALVDAINPCEFAILIILLSTILAGGVRRKALYAGLAFSAAIFLSYLAMGLGLYSVVSIAGFSGVFMKIIGVIAILLGIFNLKDFFFYGKGFLMEVPLGWRPKMKAILRSVTGPFGAFVIGVIISLFLLPCTSGPYVVVTSLLSQSETFWYAFRLLVLYNVIFVSPMIAITLAVYYGFSVEKAEEIRQKRLRTLHLIAGLLLLAMGAIVLVQFGG